jgi:hypothetical protein
MTLQSSFEPGITLGSRTGGSSTGTSSTALNTAANAGWLAYGFNSRKSGTVNKITVRVSAVNGTLDGNDLTCEIYSQKATTPFTVGTSLASSATVTATPTGAAYVEFTGFSQAVVAGTQYYIVLKNAAAAPTTDYPTYLYGVAGTSLNTLVGSLAAWGSNVLTSTDSGTNWTNAQLGVTPNYRIEYSDGSFEGFAFSAIGIDTTNSIYSAREAGAKFTTPVSAKFVLAGLAFGVAKSGTPTGDVRFRLYEGVTLIATTGTMPLGNLTATGTIPLYFATPQTLKPNTVYRVVVSETTQADTSSNRYQIGFTTIQDDANTKALVPLGMVQTYTSDATANPVVFTDTDTKLPLVTLIISNLVPIYSVTPGYGGAS